MAHIVVQLPLTAAKKEVGKIRGGKAANNALHKTHAARRSLQHTPLAYGSVALLRCVARREGAVWACERRR